LYIPKKNALFTENGKQQSMTKTPYLSHAKTPYL